MYSYRTASRKDFHKIIQVMIVVFHESSFVGHRGFGARLGHSIKKSDHLVCWLPGKVDDTAL
jgi:hypothetical protein